MEMELKEKKKLAPRWQGWEYNKGWVNLKSQDGEIVHSISVNELLKAWFDWDEETFN